MRDGTKTIGPLCLGRTSGTNTRSPFHPPSWFVERQNAFHLVLDELIAYRDKLDNAIMQIERVRSSPLAVTDALDEHLGGSLE